MKKRSLADLDTHKNEIIEVYKDAECNDSEDMVFRV